MLLAIDVAFETGKYLTAISGLCKCGFHLLICTCITGHVALCSWGNGCIFHAVMQLWLMHGKWYTPEPQQGVQRTRSLGYISVTI